MIVLSRWGTRQDLAPARLSLTYLTGVKKRERENPMGYIYKITNTVNGKSYIGQTIHAPSLRIENHLSGKSKRCRLLYNAIQEYGRDAFDHEILHDDVSPKKLSDLEKLAIRENDTLAPNGYNLTEGGEGIGKKPPRIKPEPLPAPEPIPPSVFNIEKFRDSIRTVSQPEIAKALGISPQAVSNRLRNLENIRLREFLVICEVIDEPYETFIENA